MYEETIRPALSYGTVLDIRGLYGASLSSRCFDNKHIQHT